MPSALCERYTVPASCTAEGPTLHPVAVPRSIEGVCEIETFGDPGPDPGLLIEVPHGATEDAHFLALRAQMNSTFPDDLIEFFRVNTDFGAPELARATAAAVAAGGGGGGGGRAGRTTIVVRGIVPRTLVDLNRALDSPNGGGMTPGLPPYVRRPEDHAKLAELWRAYQRTTAEAYDAVCGRGGIALALHTYAPRSVGIDSIGDDIVVQLRRAYEPATFETWPLRPPADLILPADGDGDGVTVHRGLVSALARRLTECGLETTESATYRLLPATIAHLHAAEYPGATACLEVRRDLVGDPWNPFVPSALDRRAIARIARAVADACLDAMLDPHRPR